MDFCVQSKHQSKIRTMNSTFPFSLFRDPTDQQPKAKSVIMNAESQLAVISLCSGRTSSLCDLAVSAHAQSREAESGSPRSLELETDLFQHLICFAVAAPFWECAVFILVFFFWLWERFEKQFTESVQKGMRRYFTLAFFVCNV